VAIGFWLVYKEESLWAVGVSNVGLPEERRTEVIDIYAPILVLANFSRNCWMRIREYNIIEIRDGLVIARVNQNI